MRYDGRNRNLPADDDGLWHHVAVPSSNERDEARLYVNKMAPVFEDIWGDVKTRSTDDAVHIGEWNGDRHSNGALDELRKDGRPLSKDEIYE